jgi:UDP-N-acetylmuramate dehydrogenase
MTSERPLADQLRAALRGEVHEELPLAPRTHYRIGGPAQLAVLPVDADDLALTARLAAAAGAPLCVLGGGANVLVSDRGVRGVVVLTSALRALSVEGRELSAGAGLPSHEVALAALAAGLSGAEFLAHLPGSIGGACTMNARAHGGEVSQVLARATVVSRGGERRRVDVSPAEFAYKRSPFQGSGAIVAEATLTLAPGDAEAIRAQMEQIGRERRSRHELDFPSCGCVFKNDRRFGAPSGQLIERCGCKGLRIGDAQVSEHHANFVFNVGRATASDVRRVIEAVQRTVRERTGFELEPEVQLVGDWD